MASTNFYIFMHFMSIYLHFIYICLVFIDFYYLFISRIIHLIFLLSLRQKWSSGEGMAVIKKKSAVFCERKQRFSCMIFIVLF